jgi:hypothetical protein
VRFTFHQKEIKGEKFNKLVIKMENQIQKVNKEDNPLLFEMESKLDLLVKGQESNSNKLEGIGNELRKGFIGLALRNEELLKSNDQLKQQLDDVLKELNVIKQEREEKAARREKWAKRKRLPKRDPIKKVKVQPI